MQITAIGRQWMWKFQHPGGQSEIDDLHVPVGEPVVIRMISQDVIHALYIPALRIQMEYAARPLHRHVVQGRHSPARTTCSARNTAAPTIRRWTGC